MSPARRRRRRRLLVVSVLTTLVVLGGVAWWLLLDSSVFAVTAVRVVGNRELTTQQITAAASVPLGGPLLTADLDGARRRVAALPQVAEVTVSRSWPHTVVIAVEERSLAAVVARPDGRYDRIDPSGVDFGPIAAPPPGIAVIAAGNGPLTPDALRAALVVVDALDAPATTPTPWPGRIPVAQVIVVTVQDIRLGLTDGSDVEWGSADDSSDKVRDLRALLPRHAGHYDVSAPQEPAVSGAAPGGSG